MKIPKRSAIFAPVIMGITAVLTFLLFTPKLTDHGSGGKSQIAKIQIKELEGALQLFRFDAGRYPTTDEGLNALIHNPGNLKSWMGPYIQQAEAPKDPWGRPYTYRCPPQNGTYDLICYGRDGAPGGEGEDGDIIRLKREFLTISA